MKKFLEVGKVKIGDGIPKVCVPMTCVTKDSLLHKAAVLRSAECDIVEWRADFFENVDDISEVINVLGEIKKSLGEKILIFTFRSFEEGGNKKVKQQFYAELNKNVILSKIADIIDIELFNCDVKSMVNMAHQNSLKVVLSNHDFESTPEKSEILRRLNLECEFGADICKIAVMPVIPQDVLSLLEAGCEMKRQHENIPVVTISMGGMGLVSRFSGEIFGSDITFASSGKSSAPGQISIEKLNCILKLVHKNIKNNV